MTEEQKKYVEEMMKEWWNEYDEAWWEEYWEAERKRAEEMCDAVEPFDAKES